MIRLEARHGDTKSSLDTKGAEVELNLQFYDLYELSSNSSPYTYHFTLPMTNKNNQFFSMYYNVNVSRTDFDPHVKTNVEIFDDGVKVLDGFLELTSVNVTSKLYEVVIISTLSDVFDKIKGAEWIDVLGTEIDHTLSSANVISSWTTSNDITGGAGNGVVVYPLVDLAVYSAGGIDEHPFFTNGNLVGIYDSDTGIDPRMLRPMVKVSYLLEKIMSYAGLSVTGSFLSSISNLYTSVGWDKESLIGRPFYTSRVGLSASTTLSTTLTQLAFTNESSPFADPENFFNSGIFTAPATGYFAFQVQIRYEHNASSYGQAGGFGSQIIIQSENNNVAGDSQYFNYPASAQSALHIHTFNLYLDQGEQVGVYVQGYTNNGITFYAPTINNAGGTPTMWSLSGFEVDGNPAPVIEMPKNFQESTIDDWLKGVIQQFNLFLWVDGNDTKLVNIETYQDYVDNYSNSFDWSDKVDYNSDFVISPTGQFQKKRVRFTHKESDDFLNEAYQNTYNEVYGQKLFINENEHSEGEVKIGDYFAPFRLTKIRNVSGNFSYIGTELIPCNYTADFDTASTSPVLAYYHGTKFTNNLDAIYIGSTASSLYPFFSSWSESPVTTSSLCLDWGTNGVIDFADAPEINVTGVALNFSDAFCFYKYWDTYLSEVYDKNARHLRCSMVLVADDVARLQWNDRIWINDAYYRVLQINGFKVGKRGLCDVELIKVAPKQRDCSLTVTALNTNGTVTFSDTATQDCCEAYGYTWDADRGVCWWDIGHTEEGGGNNGNPHNPSGVDENVGGQPPIDAVGFTDVRQSTNTNHPATTGTIQLRCSTVSASNDLLEDRLGQTEFSILPESLYFVNFDCVQVITQGTHIGDVTIERGYYVVSNYESSGVLRSIYNGTTYNRNGHINANFEVVTNSNTISFRVNTATSHTVQSTATITITRTPYIADAEPLVVTATRMLYEDGDNLIYEDGDHLQLE